MATKGSVIAWVRLRSTTGAWLAHPELRDRMVAEAAEQDSNLNAVAVRILSQHFNVPYEASSRKSEPQSKKDVLNFRVPLALKNAIVRAYPEPKWTDTIRYVLCAHYGLQVPAKVKLTRRRRTTTAA